MSELAQRIIECLRTAERPLKAREIAWRLQTTRLQVNSLLYGKLSRNVIKDDAHRWKMSSTTRSDSQWAEKSSGRREAVEGSKRSQSEELSLRQRAALARSLVEFSFSVRARNIFATLELKYMGDLAILDEGDLLRTKNFGSKTLHEVTTILASYSLHLGMDIPNWDHELAVQWANELGCEIEKARDAETICGEETQASLSLMTELLALASAFGRIKDRRKEIILDLYGWNGSEPKTLEAVGEKYGVTRERIRQIKVGFLKQLHGRKVQLPNLNRVIQIITSTSPTSEIAAQRVLIKQGLLERLFPIQSLLLAADVVACKHSLSVREIGGVSIVGDIGQLDSAGHVLSRAKALVSHYGCTNLSNVVARVGERVDETLWQDLVREIVNSQEGLRWLSKDKTWFWFDDTARNRLVNVVRRVLSVTTKVSIDELRASVRRVHRFKGFCPPRAVLKEFCSQLSFCRVTDDDVIRTQDFDFRETLGKTEQIFFEVLQRHGPLIRFRELEDQCRLQGMNKHTFTIYLSYSPILSRLAPQIYSLIGADVFPGQVEQSMQGQSVVKVTQDNGWTQQGEPWISYRLTRASIRLGWFHVPSAYRDFIQGEFQLVTLDGSEMGMVRIVDDRLVGFSKLLVILGADEGDVLLVTFDLQRRIACATLEDGIHPEERFESLPMPAEEEMWDENVRGHQ